jgi:hypothetical protein
MEDFTHAPEVEKWLEERMKQQEEIESRYDSKVQLFWHLFKNRQFSEQLFSLIDKFKKDVKHYENSSDIPEYINNRLQAINIAHKIFPGLKKV